MKIILTGCCGMIGTEIIIKLFNSFKKIHILGIDNLSRSSSKHNLEYIKEFTKKNSYNFEFINIDLNSTNKLFNIKFNASHLIHLADVVGGIKYVFSNEFEIFNKNIITDSNISSYVLKNKIKNYIYFGTACSFPKHLQKNSSSILFEKNKYPAFPESYYGWSKLIGEMQSDLLLKNKINACNLILHNVYGKWCDFSSRSSQVIPSLIKKASNLKLGDKLEVWGNGKQSRSFIHSQDVANFLKIILQDGNISKFNSCQLGDEKSTSIGKLALLILQNFGFSRDDIIFLNPQLTGDKGRAPDLKLSKRFGFNKTINLQDGIKDLIMWSINNKKIKKISHKT